MTPAFEIKDTNDPSDLFELPYDLPVIIYETAAIPIQRPAFRRGDQFTERGYAVLMRHNLDGRAYDQIQSMRDVQ